MATEAPKKPIHSLILDTGPLIKNAVAISTIINSAEEVFTTSAIVSEIRDEATRSRVQTTLMPFLKVRNPSPASYDAVVAFSKKTGDYAALSRQDLGLLALAYEVHCERNGGPWGLREAPKQPIKVRPGEEQTITEEDQTEDTLEVTGEAQEQKTESKPKKIHKKKERKRLAKALEAEASKQPLTEHEGEVSTAVGGEQTASTQEPLSEQASTTEVNSGETDALDGSIAPQPENTADQPSAMNQSGQEVEPAKVEGTQVDAPVTTLEAHKEEHDAPQSEPAPSPPQVTRDETLIEQPIQGDSDATQAQDDLSQDLSTLNISTPPSPPVTDEDTDSDSDWITPSNLQDHQAADAGLPNNALNPTQPPAQLDVATMTIDFAMQNVLLQMNLHLLSTNMQRIKTLTSKVLRCHACFLIERDTTKQFCPRCGGASLLRVNCSTNSKGEFRLHLAKNYTYNKRGDKYSIPKPIAGTANGKWNGIGGGQGGWGRDLVLAEDQKEYVKAVGERKKKAKDLMDEDYMPGILTGDRGAGRAGGRVKVGAGKNVNAKRRL